MQSLPVSFTNHFLFLSYIRNKKKEKRTNKTFGRRRRKKEGIATKQEKTDKYVVG